MTNEDLGAIINDLNMQLNILNDSRSLTMVNDQELLDATNSLISEIHTLNSLLAQYNNAQSHKNDL